MVSIATSARVRGDLLIVHNAVHLLTVNGVTGVDRRLRAAGSPVRSVLAHPGYTVTNLQTSGPTGLQRLLLRTIGNRLLAQDVEMGVAAPVLRRDRTGSAKWTVLRS